MTNKAERVRDFMTTNPLSISPETEIMRAVHLLVAEDISGLPVTDAQGKTAQLAGQFYRFDHLPGGWLLLPAEAETATRVELDIDSQHSVIER